MFNHFLRHFGSLSRFHISDKLQKKIEEGVLADFGRNLTHVDVENEAGTEKGLKSHSLSSD